MNYRERFEKTVRHEPTDRVPYDLDGTPMTGIESPHTVEELQRRLGITATNETVGESFDERVLRALDIDFRRVGGILEPETPLKKTLSPTAFTDCWGVKRVFAGYYWDIVDPPLAGADISDLDRYPWPNPAHIDRALIQAYADRARYLYEETPYVVCAEHPFFGVMELGCWMCGFDEFLMKMALEPAFVRRFFDIILAYQKEVIELYYGALGRYAHLTTSGDDFGTQTGPFISPVMFHDMVAPYYEERIRYTKMYCPGYFFHHTCGSVFELIPDLIDAGVDILNPIQPGARHMEPERLKAAYGNALTFWGGIDTQRLLPNGSPGDVKSETNRVLSAMEDNGYVLAPAHNIQPDVPAANIVAIYEAARERYGGRVV